MCIVWCGVALQDTCALCVSRWEVPLSRGGLLMWSHRVNCITAVRPCVTPGLHRPPNAGPSYGSLGPCTHMLSLFKQEQEQEKEQEKEQDRIRFEEQNHEEHCLPLAFQDFNAWVIGNWSIHKWSIVRACGPGSGGRFRNVWFFSYVSICLGA